jgi:Domain of unknown function (DUF4389)
MSYPVTFEVDYMQRRSRLTAFFRVILAIPAVLWLYVCSLLMPFGAVIAWVAIVITGRYPRWLYRYLAGYTRLLARDIAYLALLCDAYPPFMAWDRQDYPVRMHFDGPLERYSRWRTLLRFILAIPIVILRYVMQLLLEIGGVAAWFVIVITGGMPRGLFDVMVLANSYMARSDAYLLLLTETYPPFQDEQTRAAGV